MRFLAGIAHRIAEANGITAFPQVRDTLGQIAAEVGLVDGLLHGMEAKGSQAGAYYVPDRHLLYAAQTLTQQLYPKVITTIRDLAGGRLIMVPSSVADFDDSGLAAIIDKTQKSPVFRPQERVKFFKLAWDALGSEFASRHVQYEMFCRRLVRHPRPLLPHLRLGEVQGHGGRADGELSDAGGATAKSVGWAKAVRCVCGMVPRWFAPCPHRRPHCLGTARRRAFAHPTRHDDGDLSCRSFRRRIARRPFLL